MSPFPSSARFVKTSWVPSGDTAGSAPPSVPSTRPNTPPPAATRQILALETREIYSALASRLGVWQLKWELEDLAFRVLEPQAYKRIAKLLEDCVPVTLA